MKQSWGAISGQPSAAFSILERIDVGETYTERSEAMTVAAFSILERIDVGETMEEGT